MNRIDTIVSLINDNDLVADIGCDQVEVGIKLAKRGIKSIASDISDNVIKKAKEKVKTLGLEDYIDLRTSNGLNKINDNEVNTLVIAGMGAYTIIDILNTNKRFNKIITISNNHNDLLRSKMNEYSYKVKEEVIVKESNIYYNVIVFISGKKKYTEEELLLGFNHKDLNMFNEWKNYLLNKYTIINRESKGNNLEAKQILKYLE